MQEVLLRIAPPYDRQEIDEIREGFEAMLDRQVRFKVIEDESLIGGFSVFVNGTVYDASIRAKLEQMRKRLYE